MKSEFNVDSGSCSTTRHSYDGVLSLSPDRPMQSWQFVNDVQGLLGEHAEPDPLFFVESWTLGVPAAVLNWKQRRRGQADRERLHSGCRETDSIGASCFVHDDVLYSEFLSSPRTAANALRHDAGWRQSVGDFAKRTQDHAQAPQVWDKYAEGCEGSNGTLHPMTQQHACQLLGVTATNTQKQIKAAYRRKVSQWHPDRHEDGTNEVRQLATEQMAAINEAYHLLRSALV